MFNKNICLIPAKASSSRLALKNLLKINGKELIYYGINAAFNSRLFGDNIFVSTESLDIKSVAEGYGAKVPYLRDQKLSIDPAGVVDVALDFFEKVPEYETFENLFIILPSAPMILAEDILKAYRVYCDSDTRCLMSVTETEHSALRSVYIRKQVIVPLFDQYINKKSQELESTFQINGAITILNVKSFIQQRSYFIHPIIGYEIPRKRSVDIDTKEDYMLAKFLMGDYEK